MIPVADMVIAEKDGTLLRRVDAPVREANGVCIVARRDMSLETHARVIDTHGVRLPAKASS